MDQKLSQAESIILRISRGDKDAEQELVATYYRGLMFILNRQTQNQALSEDLAQDTFIVVIQKARANGITNPAALSAFIRQTGINLLIGHKRKESRRDTHGVDNIEVHSPTDNMEISQALHSDKLLEITTQLLNELKSPRDKEILQNYFVYEQNKQQICEDLALTKEHFDRVLFRARQRLKQLIQHKLGSEDKSSKITATYLGLGIFVAAFNLQNSELKREYLFATQVRDKQHQEHLPITTPTMNSRYIPKLTNLSMPLTSKSRSV
ncbi:MAG: sigma-70 family RNA polymerase sigma factor [Paraglaciecola sp.]|uniref:RNA polymerase sigma factor n=1 Tax=Paraglaciecola sp. TaxID=1920173 RepID=UPI003298881D